MVICPVALAVGCKKCPVFKVCPVKGLIGDYRPDADATQPLPPAGRAAAGKRRAKGRKR
jgi:hypothetical protein